MLILLLRTLLVLSLNSLVMEVADVQARTTPQGRFRKIKFATGTKKKTTSADPLPEEEHVILAPDVKRIPERAPGRAPERRSSTGTRFIKAKLTKSKSSKSNNPDLSEERKATKKAKGKERRFSLKSKSSAPSRSHSIQSQHAVDTANELLGFDLDDDESPSDIRNARISTILNDDEASEDLEVKKKKSRRSSTDMRGRTANQGSTILHRLAHSMSPRSGANRKKTLKAKFNSSRRRRLKEGGASSNAVDSTDETIAGNQLDEDESPNDTRDARTSAILCENEASKDLEVKKKRGVRTTSSSPTRGRTAKKGSAILQRLARSMSPRPGANPEKSPKVKANSGRRRRLKEEGADSKKEDQTSSKKDSSSSSKKGKSPASSSWSKKTSKTTLPLSSSSRHRRKQFLNEFDWDEDRELTKLETKDFESMCEDLGLTEL